MVQPATYGFLALNACIMLALYLAVPVLFPALGRAIGIDQTYLDSLLPTNPNSTGFVASIVYTLVAVYLLIRGDQYAVLRKLRRVTVAAFESHLQRQVSSEDQKKTRVTIRNLVNSVADEEEQVEIVQIAFWSLDFATDSTKQHAAGRYDRLEKDFLIAHNPPERCKYVVAMVGLLAKHTSSTDELIGLIDNAIKMIKSRRGV